MKKTALIIGSIVLMTLSAPAQTIMPIKDYASLPKLAQELRARHPGAQVLIAFDVDNTTLRMPPGEDLGGEAWYDWQAEEMKAGGLDKMAGTTDELLAVQGVLFYLIPMIASDPNLKNVLAGLEKDGYPMIVLTSRGSEYRFVTERDMQRAGFPFERTGILLAPGQSWTYIPYDINDIAASGYLAAGDIKTFGLREAMPVSYRKGLLLTAGQHKGIMLRSLLHRSTAKIGAILYVDNKESQLRRVYDAFAAVGVDVQMVQYTGLQAEDDAFRTMPRRLNKAWFQWDGLMRFVRTLLRRPFWGAGGLIHESR
ncbi:MAG: DUF2608 domain-containing protein [Acidobacteriota bacterium]|nr:DUF2608 domain-containing protein [Acidobacteriota bacterium]